MEFKLPDIGEGLTEAEIVEWLVKEGDKVKADQPLLKAETDKAVVDIPSPAAGTVGKLLHKAGDTVQVGETLVEIVEKGGKAKVPVKKVVAKAAVAKPKKAKAQEKGVGVVGELEEASDAPKKIGKKIFLRKGAAVSAAPKKEPPKPAGKQPKAAAKGKVKSVRKYDFYGYIEHVPVKGVRKAVAKHMVEANLKAAMVTAMDDIDVTDLWDIRKKEKGPAEKKDIHLTFLPFVMKACISALQKHPYLNAAMDDEAEEIILKKYYNIGIAVDTPDGLIVPVLKGADQKSILQLAKEIEEIADRAKERKLDLSELKGGTFTITNYGSVGGTYGTPILNYPEAGILGLGRIFERVAKVNEEFVVRKILPVSLTFDHRVTDGAEVAEFLQTLKGYLQDPDLMLLEK